MSREAEEFDPEAPAEPAVGRAIAENEGLGTVVAHLYRAEVDRETGWRTRLDSTTNWAVTVIAGILAYAFSSDQVSHVILVVGMLVGVVFLIIEARRFQRYDVWRQRVRSMQENLFADALDPSAGVEQRDWRRRLSADYREPRIRMSLRVALAHRLRRVYLPILVGLYVVWLVRLAGDDGSLLEAAGVAGVPGVLVFGVVTGAFVGLFVLAALPDVGDSEETTEAGSRDDLDVES